MAGKMKQIGRTNIQEGESLTILRSCSNSKEIHIFHIGGVGISIDGNITFLLEDSSPRTFEKDNRELVAKTEYQIKSTSKEGKKTKAFSIEDLRYYSKCPYPVLIFFVDIPSNIVYWEVVDENYIREILKIEDIDKTTIKSKTLHFNDSKVVSKTNSEDIFNDFIKNPSGVASPSEVPNINTKIEEGELLEYKNILQKFIQDDLEKIFILEALIFFYSPFTLTEDTILQLILSKTEMTMVEFEFYTKKLTAVGIMTRVGDVLSVTDSKAAQGLLSELINKKGIEYIYG